MPATSENISNGVKWTGLSSGVNAIVKLIQVSILAHLLGPDSFGLIAIAYIFLTLGDIIVDMGLTTAIFHFNSIRARQYSSIFWINLILGFVMALIIFASSKLIANYYHNNEICAIVRWLSANIFIISVSRLHKTFIQKEMNFKVLSEIEIIGSIIMCLTSVVLAYKGFGVYSLVFSTLLSSFVITVLFLFLTSRLNRQLKLYISFRDIKDFFSIGIFQFLSSVIEFFSRETDTIFISSFFTFELLGYYTLCKQLAQRLYNVINPIIVKVAVPSLSVIQSDPKEICAIFYKMIQSASYINFFVYSLLAVSGYMVLYYLYGPTYTEYTWLLCIMSVYFAIQSIGSFTGILNTVFGKTKISFIWSIYRVAITLIVCYVSSSCSFGIYVIIMTVGVQILNLYPGFRLTIRKFIPMDFSKYLSAMITPFVFFISVGIIIIWSLSNKNSPWLNGSVGICITCILAFVFFFITNRSLLTKLIRIVSKS